MLKIFHNNFFENLSDPIPPFFTTKKFGLLKNSALCCVVSAGGELFSQTKNVFTHLIMSSFLETKNVQHAELRWHRLDWHKCKLSWNSFWNYLTGTHTAQDSRPSWNMTNNRLTRWQQWPNYRLLEYFRPRHPDWLIEKSKTIGWSSMAANRKCKPW